MDKKKIKKSLHHYKSNPKNNGRKLAFVCTKRKKNLSAQWQLQSWLEQGSHIKGWARLREENNKNGNGRTDAVVKELVRFQRFYSTIPLFWNKIISIQ